MFTSNIKLSARAIRTAQELKTAVPIGGSFYIIQENGYSKKPEHIVRVRRESVSRFSYGGDEDEEDSMPTIWDIKSLSTAPYAGAWLVAKDALSYLTMLKEFWEQAPKAIAAQAQAYEEKIVS